MLLSCILLLLNITASPLQPIVETHTSIIKLGINNYSMSLDCAPKKNGFNYIWEKRNDSIPPTAQGIYSANLRIYNVTPKDAGDYRCVMNNYTGAIASNYKSISIKGMQSF